VQPTRGIERARTPDPPQFPLASRPALWLIAIDLQLNRQPVRSAALVLALFLSGIIVALGLLAVGPSWHACLHEDAGEEEGSCVITLWAQGKVDAASSVVVAIQAPLELVSVARAFNSFDWPSPAFRLLPGRAPPVFSRGSVA
jgi:hypothetical protein